jgi:hypothetical protein
MSQLFLLLECIENEFFGAVNKNRPTVPDDRWENGALVECSLAGEDWCAHGKICLIVTLSTKNHIWTVLGLYLNLWSEKPETYYLSYGMTSETV